MTLTPRPMPRPPLTKPKGFDRRSERRCTKRYQLGRLLRCRLAGSDIVLERVPVVDVSCRGIGLLLPFEVRVGEVFTLRLENRQGLFALEVPMQVVRCLPGRGGAFLTGGQFLVPLSSDAWHALVW